MSNIEFLLHDLPDAAAARRFVEQFGEKHPAAFAKLLKNDGLLSDVLTIASFSPLLSTTILQNQDYLSWLGRHRSESKVRGKDELLESLGRFSLVNSMVETQVLLARFRRRELLRIFLHDIRRLATVSETTEEISNLADAILEFALRQAKQELDNRHGIPLETDEKGRAKPARFCAVSLGKLGSRELNYSSDIDLLFFYSADGSTSGQGSRGVTTNREYFVKLAELATKLVGQQTGEGAAYRVDLRLRPHGRVGALAISVDDTIRYYKTEAQKWERQVLIRSRSSAGDAGLFKKFFAAVEDSIFSRDETVAAALENVRLSKEKINFEKTTTRGFDVKLGHGGIREIEFIAQALQLAYGGHDEWLRTPHTLIAIARLSERGHLSHAELTDLFDAYEFLRRLEHLLQMENGLQTHLLPDDAERRSLFAARMTFMMNGEFESELAFHTKNVSNVFASVFGNAPSKAERPTVKSPHLSEELEALNDASRNEFVIDADNTAIGPILASLEKSGDDFRLDAKTLNVLTRLAEISPPFAELVAANPSLIKSFPDIDEDFAERDYGSIILPIVGAEYDFARRLAALRQKWSELMLEIVAFDIFDKITRQSTKVRQTKLAEASIEAAIFITKAEIERRMSISIDDFGFSVLGLGKLGGGGMDYGSDLDLILIYDDEKQPKKDSLSHAEFFSRVVEIFVTTLSAMTREGSLYRVDLRLRPDGKNGATSLGKTAFLEYLRNRAAIWEWLAYVKLRSAAGDFGLGDYVEAKARRIVHERAKLCEVEDLKNETRRLRNRLEEDKSASKRSREIDIKFGAGGMLDVYFLMRFLQLRDDVPDHESDRSSKFMLRNLFEKGSLEADDFEALSQGYIFLVELDHNLRLSVGRSTRLPAGNARALKIVCKRMSLSSPAELVERLTIHRLNIRTVFDKLLS